MTEPIDAAFMEKVSEISELNEITEFLKDDDVDKALAKLITFKLKKDLPYSYILSTLVQLQACASQFGLQGKYYETLNKGTSGTDQFKKKNVYYAMEDRINKLVDALKIQVRYTNGNG